MKIETIRLNSGNWIARPANTLGNVGYSPFPWTASYGKTETAARNLFIKNHKKYLKEG